MVLRGVLRWFAVAAIAAVMGFLGSWLLLVSMGEGASAAVADAWTFVPASVVTWLLLALLMGRTDFAGACMCGGLSLFLGPLLYGLMLAAFSGFLALVPPMVWLLVVFCRFWVCLPVAVVTAILVWRVVDERPRSARGASPRGVPSPRSRT